MELKITVWSFFLLLGCAQSLLLIAVFCRSKKNRHARNQILCLLLFIFSVIEFDHSLRLSNLYLNFPNFLYISDGLWFLIAPTLFFVARFYVQPQYRFRWIDSIHLAPFIVMQILYFNLLVASGEVKIAVLESFKRSGEYELITALFILAMMVQILIYIMASLNEFRRYHKRYKAIFSANQLGQLKLFRGIYRFFLFYFLVEFSFSTFRNFTSFESNLLDNWSLVVWTFFIYGIGYIAILNPTLLLPQLPVTSDQKLPVPNLNDNQALEQILEYILSEKPFKKSDLSLPELAGNLGLSTNRTSYLINKVHGTSFYDLINTYRVKEVKEMIETGYHKQMSIIGLSQEAGFRSKASFYKFFKREYYKTPSQFIAELESQQH
ncbi:MAG: AraC family transcriptional regulator [Saprospiraceae bacterium]|nr:AraC family transcriptional regulator [Saprospiraceae bacterium]